MMKVIVVFVLVTIQVLPNYADDNSTYTTEYDGFDIREVMKNDRLLTSYINCLLDKGPCTAEGKELKKNLPDAAENGCKKCTTRQKENADLMIKYMVDDRPDDWANLNVIYNANETYETKTYLIGDKNVITATLTSGEMNEY